MKFKTDFLGEDYTTLCWFQAKVAITIISVALALAIGLTLATVNVFLGAFLFFLSLPIILFFQKRSVLKRAERRFVSFASSSELSLELSEEGILQYSNSGETRLMWEDVYAVRESKDSYYVFLTKRKAFYFPKRSFESEEQRQEFLRYISEYVDLKKIKLNKKDD